MEKKIKLSDKQKEIIKKTRLCNWRGLKITFNRDFPLTTAKTLMKMGLAEYNATYDGIILTELGKTIEL